MVPCRYRLNWPEGASGRKSVAAVQKLANLHKLLADLGDPSVRSSCRPETLKSTTFVVCLKRKLQTMPRVNYCSLYESPVGQALAVADCFLVLSYPCRRVRCLFERESDAFSSREKGD